MMKILVLGAGGMLGHKLVQVLSRNHSVFAAVRSDENVLAASGICAEERLFTGIDALDYETVEKAIQDIRPDVILNAIGVIKHRSDSKDAITSISINSLFPHKLAASASAAGARFITFSTDCVFDGRKGDYTEEDAQDATDLYGKSKELGEVLNDGCLTIRTSIIGRELESSRSLVEWLISQRGKPVKGFRRAIYTGLTTLEMAHLVDEIVVNHAELSGLYHVSGEKINKFDLLGLVNRYFDLGASIEPEDEFIIDRSLNSDLFRAKTGFFPKSWDQMIKEMAADAVLYDDWRKLRF